MEAPGGQQQQVSVDLESLRDALQQSEQQNQLLNREYSQLLKEKEVSRVRFMLVSASHLTMIYRRS